RLYLSGKRPQVCMVWRDARSPACWGDKFAVPRETGPGESREKPRMARITARSGACEPFLVSLELFVFRRLSLFLAVDNGGSGTCGIMRPAEQTRQGL